LDSHGRAQAPSSRQTGRSHRGKAPDEVFDAPAFD
jgi:hypothetical protein